MTAYVSTGSDLSSTYLAAAFAEVTQLLNDAEATRNSANPGVAAKQNVSITADFDGRVLATTVSLPIVQTFDATGKVIIAPQDYLGATYSAFTVGTGETKSTTIMGAVLEISQKLAAAEKTIQPESDQPNNVQITYDFESLTANITGSIPFTPTISLGGSIDLVALNYV